MLVSCDSVTNDHKLKTTETYSLIVPEARSVKPRCWQGCDSWEGPRGESLLLHFLVALGVLWLVMPPSRLCLCLPMDTFLVSLFKAPSPSINIGFRAHP